MKDESENNVSEKFKIRELYHSGSYNNSSSEKLLSPYFLFQNNKRKHFTSINTTFITNVNRDIVSKFVTYTGLSFNPTSNAANNLCFINSSEVRDDYKITFTADDVFNYVTALLHSPELNSRKSGRHGTETPSIPYPSDSGMFWEISGLGKQLYEISLLHLSDVSEKYSESEYENRDSESEQLTRQIDKSLKRFKYL